MEKSVIQPLVQNVLFTHEQIQQRIKELAAEIDRDYAGKEVMMICVLNGAIHFTSELSLAMKTPVIIDFVCIESYTTPSGIESSGIIRLTKDTKTPIAGKHVIVVEDIVDTGNTMDWYLESLKNRGAKSVAVCTLLHKPNAQKRHVLTKYVAFVIPSLFVFGYGLDYKEAYRNLDDIAVLNQAAVGLPPIDLEKTDVVKNRLIGRYEVFKMSGELVAYLDYDYNDQFVETKEFTILDKTREEEYKNDITKRVFVTAKEHNRKVKFQSDFIREYVEKNPNLKKYLA